MNKDKILITCREPIIICGFAGIGKSFLSNQTSYKVIDLESTDFNKNWDIYIKVARRLVLNGYTVLLSCHKELRQKLLEQSIQFITVMPSATYKFDDTVFDSKSVYLKRYKNRGNTQEFIDKMLNNWGEYNTKLENEEVVELPLNLFLQDILIF